MYDDEIEKSVLFYLIFKNEEALLAKEDFFNIKHQKIYKAIEELKQNKEEINVISIRNKIKENDTQVLKYISDLAEMEFGCSFEYAYRTIKNLSKKRKLIKLNNTALKDIAKGEAEDIENYIEKQIKNLNNINSEDEKEKEFKDMIIETVEIIEKKQRKEYDYKYYTGIFDLDKETNGLHEEELTIIGARPGVGKTTFALQVAYNIALKGIKVGFVSLEMSETQIVQKLIAKHSRVNSNKIKTGMLNETELDKVATTAINISNLPFKITTKARTIQEIEIYARKMKNKEDLGLLIIDYIQLIRNKTKFNSREQEVADISRTLKLLSLELKIPIIGLCQLNRNAARNEPTLADLRESGAIEQDADNVIFLYKQAESEEPQQVEDIIIDLQKQRAGGLTKVIVRFDKKISEFRNLERIN